MKYLKQFGIIIVISLIGEILNHLLPLPIPASIYGFVILFLCLHFKIIPLHAVKEVSSFLIEIMPVMFVPAAVGLLDAWDVLKPGWFTYLIITVLSTIIVMGVSGKVTQMVINHAECKEGAQHE